MLEKTGSYLVLLGTELDLRFVFNPCLFRYNQAVAMTRFYKRPILLIEFDPNKSFSLQVSVPKRSVTLDDFLQYLVYCQKQKWILL